MSCKVPSLQELNKMQRDLNAMKRADGAAVGDDGGADFSGSRVTVKRAAGVSGPARQDDIEHRDGDTQGDQDGAPSAQAPATWEHEHAGDGHHRLARGV